MVNLLTTIIQSIIAIVCTIFACTIIDSTKQSIYNEWKIRSDRADFVEPEKKLSITVWMAFIASTLVMSTTPVLLYAMLRTSWLWVIPAALGLIMTFIQLFAVKNRVQRTSIFWLSVPFTTATAFCLTDRFFAWIGYTFIGLAVLTLANIIKSVLLNHSHDEADDDDDPDGDDPDSDDSGHNYWPAIITLIIAIATILSMIFMLKSCTPEKPAAPTNDDEVKKGVVEIETAYTLNEAELERMLESYGFVSDEKGIPMNRNSFPENSAGEALTKSFSWANKEKGTYTFDESSLKEELIAEGANPVWLFARMEALFEKDDAVVKYLTKTKATVEKYGQTPLSYWLKKSSVGGIIVGKNGEYYLSEEYLQILLVACRLDDTQFAFSTEYSVEEAAGKVVTWRKQIVDDNFDFDRDLRPMKVTGYEEALKWNSVLVVRQVLKSGEVVCEERFDLFDKAPIIMMESTLTTTTTTAKPTVKKEAIVNPTTKAVVQPASTTRATTIRPTTRATTARPTTRATTARPTTRATTARPTTRATTARPTTRATTSPTKDKSKDPVNQGNAQVGGGSNKKSDGAGSYQPQEPTRAPTTTAKPTTRATTTRRPTTTVHVDSHYDPSPAPATVNHDSHDTPSQNAGTNNGAFVMP